MHQVVLIKYAHLQSVVIFEGCKHGVRVWKMRNLKSMEGKMRGVENKEFGKKQT